MAKVLDSTAVRALLNTLTGATAKNIGSSTNASPTVVTITAHGFVTGDVIAVANHATNTNANGLRSVVKVDADTFSMKDMAGTAINGNGVGGATGTVQRATMGLKPHQLKDLLYNLSRRSYVRGNDISIANESTVQTIFGL